MSNSLVFSDKKSNYQTSKACFTVLIAFIFSSFALFPYQAFSQKVAESRDYKISKHFNKAMERATTLEDGRFSTKAEKRMCVRQIGDNLAYARINLNQLERSEPNHRAMYNEIRKYQAEASLHQRALVLETAKARPNQMRIKDHAMRLHADIEKAEMEHHSLEGRTNR